MKYGRNKNNSISGIFYTNFGEMIDLIYKFRFRLRELENQLKFLEDKKIQLSDNISYILEEMTKFKEII